ncbi:MAG TPA: SRPBCC domain-containing protein [Pyrinomonadaceae bacterium]|nr:SRPBCC domain-containing protein [Pyrinomonadaceae bacterium]
MATAATTKQAPRMSDEAVESRTGKTWSRWFKHLDTAGAKKMSHREIVAHLSEKHGVGPWWQQMVAVTYEQARGLRDKHEKPEGFEISVTRTIDAPLGKAFKAWTDEKIRKHWLPANLTIRKATTNKSLRISWEDGKTSLSVNFYPKGDGKSQVVVQHGKIPDAKGAAKMKKFWAQALDRLREVFE